MRSLAHSGFAGLSVTPAKTDGRRRLTVRRATPGPGHGHGHSSLDESAAYAGASFSVLDASYASAGSVGSAGSAASGYSTDLTLSRVRRSPTGGGGGVGPDSVPSELQERFKALWWFFISSEGGRRSQHWVEGLRGANCIAADLVLDHGEFCFIFCNVLVCAAEKIRKAIVS